MAAIYSFTNSSHRGKIALVTVASLCGVACFALFVSVPFVFIRGAYSGGYHTEVVRHYNDAVEEYDRNGTFYNAQAERMAPARLLVGDGSGGGSVAEYDFAVERRRVSVTGYTDDVRPFTSTLISASSVRTSSSSSAATDTAPNLTLTFEIGIHTSSPPTSSFTIPFSPIINGSEELYCYDEEGCSSQKMAAKCKGKHPISGVYVGKGCSPDRWLDCGVCYFTLYVTDVCVQLDVNTLQPRPTSWSGPTSGIRSCFYPFEPKSYLTTEVYQPDRMLTVQARFSNDPFIELQQRTKGSGDVGDSSQTDIDLAGRLAIAGCCVGLLGAVLGGIVLWLACVDARNRRGYVYAGHGDAQQLGAEEGSVGSGAAAVAGPEPCLGVIVRRSDVDAALDGTGTETSLQQFSRVGTSA